MFFSLFVSALCVCSARAFLPVSPLNDCPKISPEDDVTIDKVAGTWRLAYLLIDDDYELEEDDTCAVVEIMKVNAAEIQLLLYIDGRENEFTIDRYTKEFDVTVLSPAEWILHTSFAGLEYIHVTVIGYSPNHVILTFCVDPFTPEAAPTPNTEPDYDLMKENLGDIFKAQNLNKIFRDVDEPTGKFGRQRHAGRPSRLLRGKRHVRNVDEYTKDESKYERVVEFLKKNKSLGRFKKHLWTVVLVKDNNTSALRFIQNASMLMKYGFKIKNDQLVSFGSCKLSKK